MNNKIYAFILAAILLGAQAGYCDTPEDMKERYTIYYNNGVAFYKEKQYTNAIKEFKKVLRYAPYDNNVKNALYTAYISRGEYFLNTEKQPKKAINDFKSALFYMKYWNDNNSDVDKAELSKTETNLASLTKKYENLSTDSKFQNAGNLRAQQEIAAAGYDLNTLKGSKYGYNALVSLYDIYKSLNNQKMALENIREAVKLKPEDGAAHYKYALLLDDIGNADAAVEEYTRAFTNGNNETLESLKKLWQARFAKNPKDAEALINLGAIYQKQKQYDLAKAQYLKAQDLNPNNPVILTNIASLYLEQNNYNGAIDIYNMMIQKNPKDIKPLFYKAEAYKKLGDNKAAMAEYKKVLKAEPKNEEAQNAINSMIVNLKGDELISYLKEDAASSPLDYDKQFNLAYELHKNKNYTEAISYYKKAIAINPKMPEPYINIAQIYRLQNDTVKADAAISHGLSNIPDNKELLSMKNDIQTETAGNLYNSAAKYFNSGDYKTALDTYLKIQLQTPEVLYSIASCYFELGENEKAIEYFKRVLEKNPNDTKAMYFVANSYVNLQNTNEAINYLNKILALEPENNDAKTALNSLKQGAEGKDLDMAISFYEKKQYQESLSLLNKILAQNPKNAYAHYYKGVILEETKNPDGAIEEYKKGIAADNQFSLCYYMLAVAYDNKEEYNEAVSYYEKYLTLKQGVDDDYSKYVNSRLKELKDYLGQK